MADSRSRQLAECVAQHVALSAQEITLEPIRTGKFNSSYIALVAGRREWVLRVAPPESSVFVFYERAMMRQEPGIHELLGACTDIPIPRIVAYDESKSSLDRDYMLMDYLPGIPMSESREIDSDAILYRVGRCLAQAHSQTKDDFGYLGEHQPMDPQPSWNDAFWLMWRMLVDDIVQTGHYDQEDAKRLLSLLDSHLSDFDRRVPSSLLHMDVWAQNLLVENGSRLTGLLDWDRALWGDPEIEFAVLDYCGISQPAFWKGYGQVRDESPAALRRNAFYLLYEIQKYIVIRHGRNGDPAGARAYKDQVMEIIEQMEQSPR